MVVDINVNGISLMCSSIMMMLIVKAKGDNMADIRLLGNMICRRTLQKYILELQSNKFIVMVDKNTVMLSPHYCWGRDMKTRLLAIWSRLCIN